MGRRYVCRDPEDRLASFLRNGHALKDLIRPRNLQSIEDPDRPIKMNSVGSIMDGSDIPIRLLDGTHRTDQKLVRPKLLGYGRLGTRHHPPESFLLPEMGLQLIA